MTPVALNRVPAIVALYWLIKIAATTLGETGADHFSMTLNFGYGVTIALFLGLFLLFLLLKIARQEYSPLLYWLTFTATAIAGTAISDFIDRTLGLGYAWGSVVLLVLLMFILAVWFYFERSLNVEMITTDTSEIFYWLAFLIANTLGTAAGDYLADDLQLGFMVSACAIGALLLITLLLHVFSRINWLILFWFAFVLTRPFGANFGDLMSKSTEQGGLGFGTAGSSAVFLIILTIVMWREAKTYSMLKAVSK